MAQVSKERYEQVWRSLLYKNVVVNHTTHSWINKTHWSVWMALRTSPDLPYSGKLSWEKTNLWKIQFSWRKLSRIACFCHAKGCHAPNFAEKTFAHSHKTIRKSFLSWKFPILRYCRSTWDVVVNHTTHRWSNKTHCRFSYRILSWGGQDGSRIIVACEKCVPTRGVWRHAPPRI